MTDRVGRTARPSLRQAEAQLDRSASALDVQTDIAFRDTLRIFWRVTGYFGLFKGRIAAKIGFVTVETMFRMLIVPWPAKVVVDHVILGDPIADAAGFPPYLAPFVRLFDGMSAVEMMLWLVGLSVLMVIVFGVTINRGAGRLASGAATGTAAGASGAASAVLAQGHDTATQTENEANRAGSLMGGLLGMLDFKVNLRLTQSLNHVLRAQLAGHVKKLPLTTLEDQRIGDSVFRVLYDTPSASLLLEGLAIGLYAGVLNVVIGLGIMIIMGGGYGAAPEVVALAVLACPVTLLCVIPFARMARRRSQASRASGANTTSNIEEGMSNVLAVQSLGGNQREGQRFRRASAESFARFRRESLVKLLYQQFGTLAFMLSQAVFFMVMARRVIDGTFTAGDYFVFAYYFFVLSATFSAWGYMYTEWQVHIAGMRRVFFLLDLPAEGTRAGARLPRIETGIAMHGVGLTYPDGRQALRNINLEARVGEIIALVGPTGAGKTSLAYLVPAFVQPTVGTVKIDGVDVKDVAVDSLRQQVAYVFQETQLFSDSILDNIRYGNRNASRQQVERAAYTAGAHDFITALPEGYATNLGTVTSKLSVGQKQRIAIARGLLRDARILILDEPTSALDPETEAYLVAALREAAKEKLVIVIAHRLSTIAHAHRIYFLDEGEIREVGTHATLMARQGGRYRRYVAMQTGGVGAA